MVRQQPPAQSEIAETVGMLYKSAVDNSLWPEVAARLAKLFDADVVALCHTVNGQVRLLGEGVFNLSSRDAERLTRKYVRPTLPRAQNSGADTPPARLVDDASFARDIPHLRDRGRLLTVVVPEAETTESVAPTHLSVAHCEGRLRFSEEQQALRVLLSGHLADATRMNQSIARKQRVAEFHSTAVLHLGEAWLVIDRNDHLIECNPIARGFLMRSELLGLREGQVRTPQSEAGESLREAMAAAWSGEAVSTALTTAGDGGMVSFDLKPIYGHDGRSTETPDFLMILVHELNRDIMLKIEKQAETHRLSRAETRVMTQLVRFGQSPSGIADSLGTSERTVRCQLSSIFRKTGTRTQQELIRMTLLG